MKQSKRAIIFITLVAISVLVPELPVSAGEIETKIGQGVLKTAVTSTSVDQLDKFINARYAISQKSALANPVSKTMSVYSLGIALKNFAESKNDKSRLYAAMDSLTSGVTLVNPATGMVVQLAMLAASLTEQYLSLDFQKKILVIMRSIQESREIQYSILIQRSQVDMTRLNSFFNTMNLANTEIAKLQNTISKQCSTVGEESEFMELENCLEITRALLLSHEFYIDSVNEILNFYSEFVDINKVLTETQLDKANLHAILDQRQNNVIKLKEVLQLMIEASVHSLSFTVQKTLDESATLNSRQAFYISCINDMTQLRAMVLQNLLLQQNVKNVPTTIGLDKNFEVGRQLVEKIEEKKCFQILSQDNRIGLFGKMLSRRSKDFNFYQQKYSIQEDEE